MAGRLSDKRIVITGAVAGIGYAAAAAFLDEGARVVILDIDEPAGAEAARRLDEGTPGRIRFVPCDVSTEGSYRAAIDSAADWLGGLDALVQHAGIQRAGRVANFPVAQWDALMEVNARSVFLGAKIAMPLLRDAGRSSMVNTASVAGLRGGAGMTAYSASKGAIIAFTKAVALEYAEYGIRVNSVCPGVIDTPFNEPNIAFLGGRAAQDRLIDDTVPLKRRGRPEEVAPLFVYLVSDESSYVTAQHFVIDGGMV
jgi:NAD(P)-dependent dehydrogenase (short-subunit alcohol dehydrogenase family)